MARFGSLFQKKPKNSQPNSNLNPSSSAETSGTLAVADSTSGLPYRVSDHRGHWALWLACFVFDGAVLPVVLFYALWYGSNCSSWTGKCGMASDRARYWSKNTQDMANT